MSAGTVGKLPSSCNKLYINIHSCPSPECSGEKCHYMDVRTDLRTEVCKNYLDGKCFTPLHCNGCHCAVSAIYHAENANGSTVHPLIKEKIWNRVMLLISTNVRYYWTIVNSMNETLELLICKNARSVISSYIGDSWITKKEGSEYQLFHVTVYNNGIPILWKTLNRRILGFTYNSFSVPTTHNTCCDQNHHMAAFIMIKKDENEFIITTVCKVCYDPDEENAMYNLGLNGFEAFCLNKMCEVNQPNCVTSVNKNGTLEIVKFIPTTCTKNGVT